MAVAVLRLVALAAIRDTAVVVAHDRDEGDDAENNGPTQRYAKSASASKNAVM